MTDVELIKQKIDIVSFISDYIQIKKAGRNFKALCPFHSEKSPSFIISPERGSWHCFGACGEGGDAIGFLQKWENIDFPEALKILAKKTGITLSHFAPTQESKKKETYYEINHLASEFYHYLLTSHKLGSKAMDYLKSRSIKNETIRTFTLGYAPESWDSLSKYLIKKGYLPADIYTAGLTVRSESGRYYDRFRGRLIFTLKDQRGNIVGFSGRKLPASPSQGGTPESDKEAKYVNTSETPIYSKGNTLYGLDITRESIKKTGEAVIVEGEFDLLASFQVGVTNIVAIKGSAFTQGQTLLLKRYTTEIILALDSDFAGNEAAKRGIEMAETVGLSVKVAKISDGKDPAECISINPGLWKKAVKSAVPIYDFIIESSFAKYPGKSALEKQKISNEVIPFIAKIENPIVFSHYLKLLAKRLEVSEDSVETALRQFQRKQKVTAVIAQHTATQNRDIMLEEYILALILQVEFPNETLTTVAKTISPSDFHQPGIAKIIELLILYFKSHNKFDIKIFEKVLTAEISATFDKALLMDIENILADKTKFEKEIIQTAKELKRISLRRRLNILSTKIKEKDEINDDTGINNLELELRELLSQLKEVDISPSKD